ncbi:MAG: DUF4071 domain-containing protein [Oligoflexia bacterium]|nr:DUF4071 domain-containing protein [Oligoflexia bacterium]
MQRRGLTPPTEGGMVNPIWFLAETERNIFLWRNGRSLIEQDQFEFWIDVEALIERRLGQLTDPDFSNPFINPVWEVSSDSMAFVEAEREYLVAFKEALRLIQTHAHILSRVASELRVEGSEQRRKIVLPAHTTK